MRARRRRDQFGPVGWIFADVLLALVVVFMATQADAPPAEVGVSTSSTTATTAVTPVGVDSRFVCFRVLTDPAVLTGPASPARAAHVTALRAAVEGRLMQGDLVGRRAGIVLSFGVAAEAPAGKGLSEAVNRDVLGHFGQVFRRSDGAPVASQAYWDGQASAQAPEGSVAVYVYPIIDADHPPLGPEYGRPC